MVTSSQQQATEIAREIQEYGVNHATWLGLADTVGALSARSGQRIRVETSAGALLADSDLIAGGTARGVVGVPVLVDARPVLVLPTTQSTAALARVTVGAITEYRRGAVLAACLTEAGVPVTATVGDDGIPRFQAGGTAPSCSAGQVPSAVVSQASEAAFACAQKPASATTACLTELFSQQVAGFAPELLRIHLGAEGETVPTLRVGPTVLAAFAVVATAMLGALLLSRSVLRPVRVLMAAAQELGSGHRGRRVSVSGRDEIAQLGRTFNAMADSLQSIEESQRRMIADIAHELRTPLANLRGYLEAMRDGVMAATPELLDSLHEEVLLQQRVVDDLQDLALAESGQLGYDRRQLDLRAVLEVCFSAHRAPAEAAGVRLTLNSADGVWVFADPDRLRQVVGNLITNAVRATHAGGAVSLKLRRSDDRAVVEVTDTGTGIAPDDLPHVFDRFWRADPARGRGTGGSGLGLAIARQIVADHGGTIEVTSRLGTGSTFTIQLPIDGDAHHPDRS